MTSNSDSISLFSELNQIQFTHLLNELNSSKLNPFKLNK